MLDCKDGLALSPLAVYIVDADEFTQKALARVMRAAGFKVVCTRSVEELMKLERPDRDAIILVDENTAHPFAESIPRYLQDKQQTLPVIFLTDYDSEHAREEARRAGAVGYFRKPVDDHALLDTISFAVQHS
ncbi:MAG: response regulator [Xanthomonadales bacterium]|nr:response regulator [Xanthomonadales bacterium]